MFGIRVLAGIILAAALVAPVAAQSLEGRVLEDHSGKALASAGVRVFRAGERTVAADLETDGSGRFQAPELAPGEYRLEVAKPNYVATKLSVRLPLQPLTIRLVRLGVITGRVTNAEGKPLRGGRVVAMVQPAGNLPLQATRMTTTVDDTGQYRLYGLPPGRYAVAVSFATANPSSGSAGLHFYPSSGRPRLFGISGGEEYEGIDFVLLPTPLYRVSGTVELPAPGRAVVSLFSPEQPSLPVVLTWTESDGKFRAEGVPPGSYELVASSSVTGYGGFSAVLGPDALYGRMRVEVTASDVGDIAVALSKGRSASFVLRAAGASKPPEGCPSSARLALTPLEALGSMRWQGAEVGFDKPATVENLPPGRYQAELLNLGEGCYAASQPVVDVTGRSAPEAVALEVAPAGLIRGRIVGAEAPERFAVALLAEGQSGQAVQVALPGADERFAFGGLPPGRYRIGARAAGEPEARWVADIARMFEIEVRGGAATEVDLPAPKTEP